MAWRQVIDAFESPTARQGYILRASEDLLGIMQIVTGKLPAVFAITTQDITP